MEEHTGRFTAYTEDGETVELDIYTDFIAAPTRRDPNGIVPGTKRIVGPDGSVDRIEQGRYKVVQTGVILTSNGPEAP